jgi:hypothetical protein
MNNKLQKLAIKMEGLFPDTIITPQDCYDKFKQIYEQQKDYFINFEPIDIVVLIFYIFSYKKTGDFKIADNLISRISFASLFITQGNIYQTTCEYCNGDGDIECEECYGSGEITCSECDGDESERCSECNGKGTIKDSDGDDEECTECDGEGKLYCRNCDGNGTETCNYCGGDGRVSCNECDGTGEVDSGELEYEYYVICTWDNSIRDACELNAGTMNPAMSEYDFDRLRDYYIKLGYQEDHMEFRTRVQLNEVYCTNFEGNTFNLHKSHGDNYQIWMDDDNMDKYTL